MMPAEMQFVTAPGKGISQAELMGWLDYDPSDGVFRWRKANSNRVKVGAVAGTIRKNQKYIVIVIKSKFFYAHRLAWLYMYGVFPSEIIDHIDGNPSNNSIRNLRESTYHQNAWNTKARKVGKSGYKGVWKTGNKWAAYIHHKGVRKRIGTFNTAMEAHNAYVKTTKSLHGDFCQFNE